MMMMMTTKKIQEKEEKPNPGPGGGGGSTSISPGGGPDDRISELPKEILHHILGLLEMDEFLIGTSLVSTKWRYLWKSVSTLNFPVSVVDNGGGGRIRNNVERYQNFVGHVLRLRDAEASKIEIFRYHCHDFSSGEGGGYEEDYLERLHNFIVSAVVNQGAQQIQVQGGYHFNDGNFHFDPSIFNSGLLRVFNFTVRTPNFGIHFPRSMCCCATQLTYLSLHNIRLPEGDESNDELHLVCPLLETLFMRCCDSKHLKVLDISAPRLITLSICNYSCLRSGDVDFLGGCRIEIRTPNLTSLDYSGCVYVDCFTENLPLITDAKFDFSMETGMVEQTNSFAFKLFKGLSSAKILILKGFEVFSLDTLKVLLSPFTSLRTLELKSSCKVSASIHVMVHILNSCNSIEKFVWKAHEFVVVEGGEDLMLPQCRLSHLKHVHIQNLHVHENQIEFVKFLLKSSVVLEDLIINTIENSPKRLIEENLKQFIEEKPSFRSIKLHIL